MARRYSGKVTVSILWDDHDNRYAARVKADGSEQPIFVTVGAPKILEHAVDSPEAYDAAAKAAIAFADDDVPGTEEQAAFTESGYFVSRKHKERWPR
jgi:hypothetical protein